MEEDLPSEYNKQIILSWVEDEVDDDMVYRNIHTNEKINEHPIDLKYKEILKIVRRSNNAKRRGKRRAEIIFQVIPSPKQILTNRFIVSQLILMNWK